jgi:hypothetical protein
LLELSLVYHLDQEVVAAAVAHHCWLVMIQVEVEEIQVEVEEIQVEVEVHPLGVLLPQ